MTERRRAVRKRVIYGALAARPGSGLRDECVIRNCSDDGANVEMKTPPYPQQELALSVPQQGKAYRGRVVWVEGRSAGVAFTETSNDALMPAGDLTEELKRTRRKARRLQRRVDQLLGQD